MTLSVGVEKHRYAESSTVPKFRASAGRVPWCCICHFLECLATHDPEFLDCLRGFKCLLLSHSTDPSSAY